MDKLPISVNIATYNEESNIAYCLECVWANNPSEVVVIDAGSTDRTAIIANEMGAKVITVAKNGLAFQRAQGLKHSTQPFIALVDAQDKIEKNCLKLLLEDMEQFNYDAIQAQTFARKLETYWEIAYNFNTTISLNQPGPTNMVGRPCLYRTDKIVEVGFDPFFSFGVGCEDVDVSIQFEKKGFTQAMGRGRVWRDHPSDFKTWWKKWVKYGRGDARIIAKYPAKRKAIRKHQLWNYPVKRSIDVAYNGGTLYVPFFILFGLVRFFSSLQEGIRLNEERNLPRIGQ